jgi:hypothetical protein
MGQVELEGWTSGWFWIGGYEPSAGFAALARGQVGEVTARITVQVWDGLAEVFFLRYDPARQAVDLIARMDPELPWSLESTVSVPSDVAQDLDEAASTWSFDPEAFFELLVAANRGLEITTLQEADALGQLPAEIAHQVLGEDVWARSNPVS